MATPSRSSQRVRFGEFELDLSTRELSTNGAKQTLARIMHEEWNADRIVDGAMHDCDECQNLPRVYD